MTLPANIFPRQMASAALIPRKAYPGRAHWLFTHAVTDSAFAMYEETSATHQR